jgi:tetratricopeptide (TPR) repeat protein
VKLDPQSAGGHERLALALIALGESNGAERHLQSAIQLAPGSALAHRMLAGIYMARKDWEAVDTELDALERLSPGNVEPHLARAEFLALLGAYDEAAAEYEEAAAIQRRAATGVVGQDASLAAARFYIDMQGGAPRARLVASAAR